MRKLAALLLLLALAGCDESMDKQNRLKTYGEAKAMPGWPAEGEALPLPPGTVAQGSHGREQALTTPPPVNLALLQRGQQRLEIYCTPCHGLAGAGDGMVVARGFPKPLPFNDPTQMQADAHRMMDAISNGSGRMYGFSDRVEPADRWAIIAYIRALQLADSRKATP
jgi:mono/diheme cytochrome c family protein